MVQADKDIVNTNADILSTMPSLGAATETNLDSEQQDVAGAENRHLLS